MKDWTKVVRRIQKEKKMSQLAISEATGIDQPTISRLLNGAYKRPTWETGDKLLTLLEK